MYQLFCLLIEAPLKKTKETTEVFLQQFRHLQQITMDQGDYSTIAVAIGFGKGERALVELINIIDIALGDAEGKLSRNKVAILAASWKLVTKNGMMRMHLRPRASGAHRLAYNACNFFIFLRLIMPSQGPLGTHHL